MVLDCLYWLAPALILSFNRAARSVWTLSYAMLLCIKTLFSPSLLTMLVPWSLFGVVVLVLYVPCCRRVFTCLSFKQYQRAAEAMPIDMSQKNFSVSWLQKICAGKPDWQCFFEQPSPTLTKAELFFLNGPVEQLCSMCSDWAFTQYKGLPERIIDYLKTRGFWALTIPEAYNGLGFSTAAVAQIVAKCASVSAALGAAIAIPNAQSLASVLMAYGSETQRKQYLSPLAVGEAVPCLALSGLNMAADLDDMMDHGVVTQAMFEGKEQLCVRLRWHKQGIAFAPLATLLGVFFNLYDPEGLLGGDAELGLTGAVLPVSTAGVSTGQHHYPLMSALPVGPTRGQDVLIPLTWIIGERAGVGQGEVMLADLSAGQAMVWPAVSLGSMKKTMYASLVQATVRQPFGQAPSAVVTVKLAEMLAATFVGEASHHYLLTSVPCVGERITQLSKQVHTTAMDIHVDQGVCLGPHNPIAQATLDSMFSVVAAGSTYTSTAALQLLSRCHPHHTALLQAAAAGDRALFDEQASDQFGFGLSNALRVLGAWLSRGRFGASHKNKRYRRECRQLNRMADVCGFLTDMSVRHSKCQPVKYAVVAEHVSKMLRALLQTAALLRYAHEHQAVVGESMQWPLAHSLYQCQQHALAVCHNFPKRLLRCYVKRICFPIGSFIQPPTDIGAQKLLSVYRQSAAMRELIMLGIYRTDSPKNMLGQYEKILSDLMVAAPLEQRVYQAVAIGKVSGKNHAEMMNNAIKIGILSEQEGQCCLSFQVLRKHVLRIENF